MTYTDEQCEQFYWDILWPTTYTGGLTGTQYKINCGRGWLERLERAGCTIEFPVKVEYKVHETRISIAGMVSSGPMYALYKYTGEHKEWIGDFKSKEHAEAMRDMLTQGI